MAAHDPRNPGAARHLALIMDGNGRWAEARGQPRIHGHEAGVESVRAVTRHAARIGLEQLTLYAFSTENWRRPPDEVAGLMDLFRRYLAREMAELAENGVRVVFIGDPAPLAKDIRALMAEVERKTAGGRRMTLALAINYGGRAEIAAAARRLAERAAAGEIAPEDIDEDLFAAHLGAAALPDPDLVIRTSGEQRLSNFLMWQAAYAELMFVPETWPEFTPACLRRAVEGFGQRDRRFGAV